MNITIEPRTRWYDDVINDAIRSFPSTDDVPTLTQYKSEPGRLYAFGAHDLIMVLSDPTFIKVLIGIGTVLLVGPGKKMSELAAEDIYKWFKQKLLKKTCEEFPRRWKNIHSSSPSHGTNIYVRSVDESVNFVLDIKYNQDPKGTFDDRTFTAQFAVFENILRPVINRLAKDQEFARAVIEANVGPETYDGRRIWLVSLSSSRNSTSHILLVATSDGHVDWERLDESIQRVVREVLSSNPPFVTDGSQRIFHWRDCEKIAETRPHGKSASFRGEGFVDHDDAIQRGLQACELCIG